MLLKKIFIFLLFIFSFTCLFAETSVNDKVNNLENINENFSLVFYLLLGLIGILFLITMIMIITHFGYRDLSNIILLVLVLLFFSFLIFF